MAIEVELVDGRILEFPDGTSPDVIQSTAKRATQDKYFGVSTTELKAAPSAPMSLGDTARAGIAGLTGALGSAVSAFGADTAPAQGLRSLTESIQSGMTPERLEEQRRREELMKRSEQEGLGSQIMAGAGAIAEAPVQAIAQGIGSSIPAIAAGLATVVAGAPAAIAGAVGLAARAIFGAVQGAGEAKGDIYSSVKAKLMESGKSEAQAEAEAAKAQEYVGKNLPGIIGSSLAGVIDAATGVESIVGKGAFKSSVKPLEKPSLLREAFKQAGAEALPEGIQGGVGQVTQNVALQNAGFDPSTFEGVAGATTRDALMGALTGGAVTPLQMSSLRRDYELDKQRKVDEESRALEEKLAQEEQARQEQIIKTKEDLGLNAQLPALPAPAEEIPEPVVAVDPLKNPLGNIQKNEIPEISQVIDEYRQNAGLPPLKDYSVEDLVDAMPGEDPKGEEALLNQWLTAKTGWTKENKMTAQNVLEQAKLKNIETKTKGFEDFLARVTGYRDLTTMSQPQLYAAFTALSSLPESDTTQILPEGTNASRFSEEQYLKALVGVDQLLDGLVTPDGNPIPVDRNQVIREIQQYTGLTNTEHAESILDEAIRTGDLDSVKTPRYRTVDPATGQLKGVAYDSRKAAEAAAKQKGYEIKEITAEGITAPSTAATLPEGFDIRKGSFKEGETPEGYSILSGDEDLYQAKTPEEAASKKTSFEKTRSGMANAIDNQITQKLNSVEQSQIRLDRMEAKGEGQTVNYAKAKGKHAQLQETVNKDIEALLAKKAGYEAPIAIKPFGKKAVGRTGFTIFEGSKATATYPSRTAAEEAILTTLSDNQLRQLTKDQGRRGLGKRAETELKRRTSPPPAQGKKVSEVLEGIEEEKRKPKPVPPEVKANIEKLEKELRPLLEKLGLGKVTLNVVQDIENNAEGAFSKTLMRIAMDSEKPVRTMRHESIHALKELGFFTPAQWNTLQRMAKDKWIQTYLKDKNAIHNGKSMTRFDAYMDIYGGNMETIMEEAIADAFADFDVNKAPPGLITALLNRIRAFFEALRNAMAGAGFQTAEEVFGMVERGELVENPSAWKATPEEQDEAARYSVNNGIDPYTSDGQLNVPLESDGTKYSIKQAYTEEQKAKAARTENRRGEEKKAKILKNDPITGLPLNQNGTVTLYYPTDNDGARALAKSKRLKGHSPEANRIYLTNESSAPAIAAKPGMIEQPLGGANVLLEIDPSLIHELPTNYADGRRDFFIPIAEGEVFAKKMKKTKLFTLNALRTKGLHPDRTLAQVTKMVNDAASKWGSANEKDRRVMAAQAKETLLADHNITNLFGANSKLEKTNIGEYGLTYDGKKVMSTGLGFASAQKINDEQRATTCPQSGICEDLCLGETSGQNLLYGGEGQWRSGPRLSQYLKTEALVVNPEAFAIAMIKQITSFRKAANDLGYYPAVRLNVTSDFNPKTFEGIIKMFPDVMFYDYTKLDTKPIAPNHHLTYSSTGASQVVDGDIVYNKFSNWDRMVDKVLPSGRNVAMAFTSRSAMPKFVLDQRTGKRFEVWNGDEYDARFLDPIKKDGDGWIIGLTNKDNTTKPEDAAKKHNGFFLDYDPERDGDTLVIQDQEKLKAGIPQPVTFKKPEKYSLRQVKDIFSRAEGIPEPKGVESIRNQWIGGVSGVGDRDSMYDLYRVNGSKKYIQDVQDFIRKELGNDFKGYRLMSNEELEELETGAMGSQFVSFTLSPDVAKAFKNIPAYASKTGMSVVEMDLTPEHVAMIGHPGELELVVDYGQGYNPSNIKAVEKYSLRAAPGSPEFKQWFGDSKIVDAKGQPIIVYHATNFSEEDKIDQENVFSVFKESDDGKLGAGIYSSSLPKYAESYGPTGTVMPLYASIQNPLVINMDADGVETDVDGYQSVTIKVGIRANTALEGVAKKILAKNPDFKTESKRYLRGNEVQKLLEMGGYDGVVLEDSDGNFVEINAFKPEQLKSATGNIGTYDAASPDIRYSLKEAPDTPKFKRFFAGSKVINEDGTPKVMYHGTNKDFNEFLIAEKANRTGMPDGFYFTSDAEDASRYAKGEGANVMPVYLSIKNPYDLGGKNKISKEMVMQFRDELREDNPNLPFSWIQEKVNIFKENTAAGRFPFPSISFPTAAMQRVFEAGGYDGLIDGSKVFVAFNPSQVKSATGNVGTFDKAIPDVRFSLRYSLDPDIKERVNATTTSREDEGFIDRMMEAIAPSTYSRFRAQALNRYDQLSKYDKMLAEQMGGVDLLADASAEAAALMSDLGAGITASVLGVHDRNGGIPVFRKGITTVDGSVKGPISIFVPLAKLNDPAAYRDYQFWSGVKRGRPFIGEGGKEQLFKEGDIKKAELLEKEYKDMGVSFDQIQKEWIQYNNGLVKYLVDTGVLSQTQADLFTKWSDYIPFYRQMDGEKTVGPNIFQSISGVKQPKKYKGETEAPLADFLETIVRNTQSAIQMGVKNTAAQRAVSVATQIQMAEKLKFKPKSMISVVTVLEDGKETYYDCYDPLFIESVKSLNMPDLPFIGLLAAPANILRNLVTKDPGFMMANMMRDSLSAWVTSGAKMTPIASTIANFGKSLAGTSPEFKALLNAGILGGYEFSQNTEQSGQTLAQALRLKAGTGNLGDKASSLWGLLEKGTTASDAATRIEVYKSTLAETGNEAEALFRSLEVMNFNRKGSSAVIRVMTAAIPFLNARMQGLDVLYRAGIRPLTDKLLFGKEPTQREKEIQRIFFVRGMTIAALSAMYWMLTNDEEEYKKQEQETKDNYWLFPSLGIKIPIPFEVGVIFKVLPERLMALTIGEDTAKDFRESMARNIRNTLAIDYLPQTIKPIVEVESNFSYFTRRPIIGQGLDGVGDPFQVGPTTSLVAEKIGKQTGMSPMKIDHLINGYTGTIGMYMVDALDAIMDMNSDSPKASKRFEQMPVLKRFALDPEARGNVSAYYEMKNSVDEVVRTSNLLERTSNYKEWGPYMEDNIKLLATKDYILDLENSMKEFREMQVLIRSSSLSADEKRDALLNITKAQNALTSNIQLLKKNVQ